MRLRQGAGRGGLPVRAARRATTRATARTATSTTSRPACPTSCPGLSGTYGRQYYVDVPQAHPLVRYIADLARTCRSPTAPGRYAAGSPRYNWTAAAIDGARAAGIPWVVVGMHKPCLSIGEYACESGLGPDQPAAGQEGRPRAQRARAHLPAHQAARPRAGCTALVPGTYNASCVVGRRQRPRARAPALSSPPSAPAASTCATSTPPTPRPAYFAAYAGLNVNPTFGVLDVSATADVLTANFRRASGGTFTDAFTITRGAPPPNQPPVAAFTAELHPAGLHRRRHRQRATPTGRSAATPGSSATAPPGPGVTASHTYAAAGTYTITLTVTDDDGATAPRPGRSRWRRPPTSRRPRASRTAAPTWSAPSTAAAPATRDGTIASYAWNCGDGDATAAAPRPATRMPRPAPTRCGSP